MTFYVLVVIVFVAGIVSDICQMVADDQASAMRDAMKSANLSEETDQPADSPEQSQEGQNQPPSTGEQDAPKDKPVNTDPYQTSALVSSVFVFFAFVLFGSVFYSTYEDCSCSYGATRDLNYAGCIDDGPDNNCASKGSSKTFGQAFYMSVITLTTVGFGDFAPLTRVGRMIGIVWMLIGIVALGNMITCIAVTKSAVLKAMRQDRQNMEDMLGGLGVVLTEDPKKDLISSEQFLKYMLLKNELVKQEDLDQLAETFNSLNPDKDGNVTIAKVQELK